MAATTINEALIWLKTLRARHAELVSLRNENSKTETRYYGANADKSTETKPTYDVKKLDLLITAVATEIRLCDMGVKKTNASAVVVGYEINEAALGQVE